MTEANPDMPFPDVGRMLGEMWHNLTHEEKEEYRDGNVSPFAFGQPLSGFCSTFVDQIDFHMIYPAK